MPSNRDILNYNLATPGSCYITRTLYYYITRRFFITRTLYRIIRLINGLTRQINGWGFWQGPGGRRGEGKGSGWWGGAAAQGPGRALQLLISRARPLTNQVMPSINRLMPLIKY